MLRGGVGRDERKGKRVACSPRRITLSRGKKKRNNYIYFKEAVNVCIY